MATVYRYSSFTSLFTTPDVTTAITWDNASNDSHATKISLASMFKSTVSFADAASGFKNCTSQLLDYYTHDKNKKDRTLIE